MRQTVTERGDELDGLGGFDDVNERTNGATVWNNEGREGAATKDSDKYKRPCLSQLEATNDV